MKKQIQIYGTPVGAIKIGSSAVIIEDNCTRRTSRVLSIYAKSNSRLVFETKNTVYFLQYPKSYTPESIHSSDKYPLPKLTFFHMGDCKL